MNNTNTTTVPASFQGYKAKMGDKVVWVMNSDHNAAGEPILKVRIGTYAGQVSGWERVDTVYRWGNPIWVKASRVTR